MTLHGKTASLAWKLVCSFIINQRACFRLVIILAGSGFGALKHILEHKPDLFVPSGNTNIDSDDRLNAARIYSYVR